MDEKRIEQLKSLKHPDIVHWIDGKPMTVMAVHDRFIIMSNKEEKSYSIVDLKRGVCGASDRVFDTFDYYTVDGAYEAMKHLTVEPVFEPDYTDTANHTILKRVDDNPEIFKVEVSYRNNAPIDVCIDFNKTFIN
ncbi:hypothetical protein LC76P1_00072 [Lysinibacillus phage LC76P1]|nr:hypothetical protein LC76P1_00072 [Lysinibacillus phage LC76P1]